MQKHVNMSLALQKHVNRCLAMQKHVNTSLATQKHVNTSLAMQIIFAREFLKEVRMKADQVKYLVTNARNGMCQGHRAELFAVKAAKACAAIAVSLSS
jgi:magnesium chelatase subunit D